MGRGRVGRLLRRAGSAWIADQERRRAARRKAVPPPAPKGLESVLSRAEISAINGHYAREAATIARLQNPVSWEDRNSVVRTIEQMAPQHRQHLLWFLERRADRLHEAAMWFRSVAMMACLADGVEFDIDREEFIGEMTPIEWLHDQPLAKRLIKLGAKPSQFKPEQSKAWGRAR